MKRAATFLLLAALVVGLSLAAQQPDVQAQVATVTATWTLVPSATLGGVTVFVPDQVNVRVGPGTQFDQVGVLIAGQTAPAVGRTEFGEWIQIEYFGAPGDRAWVFAPLVVLREGTIDELQVATAPPTATRPPTATFAPGVGPGGTPLPTRLPTFTPAPPVVQPTFAPPDVGGGGFPPALIIIGLFVVGILSGIVAILRQRG
ncbi:MAG: SH3 domain-containing protein [Anaerolineales bacterium]